MILFAVYVLLILSEKTETPFRVILPSIVIEGLNVLLILVGTALGTLFVIEDSAYLPYVPGPWDTSVGILSFLCMVSLYIVLFRYRKFLGVHQFTALCGYMVIPLIVLLIQFFQEDADFTYAGLSAALLLIYIEVQYVAINEASIREKVLNEISMVDALTGLGNRRAYDEALRKERKDGRMGVGFFDLNRLKYTNDTFGHGAGDRLIVRFSKMLSDAFPDGELFRISGDEFTVVFEGMTEEGFDRRMKGFHQDVRSADRIASLGYVYRDGGDLLSMIREAEKAMYRDKSAFYRETGIDRRK